MKEEYKGNDPCGRQVDFPWGRIPLPVLAIGCWRTFRAGHRRRLAQAIETYACGADREKLAWLAIRSSFGLDGERVNVMQNQSGRCRWRGRSIVVGAKGEKKRRSSMRLRWAGWGLLDSIGGHIATVISATRRLDRPYASTASPASVPSSR